MLYNFLLNFVDIFSFLNVFKYITFRTGLAVFTSLIIVLLIGNPFIRFFANKEITNPIRNDGPSDHIIKKIGTPTMGGLIILTGLLISVLMWGDLKNIYIIFEMLLINKIFKLYKFYYLIAISRAFSKFIGLYFLPFYNYFH